MAALGIETVADLIEHFPFRYEHQAEAVAVDALRLGDQATVVGRLRSVRRRGGYVRPSLLTVLEDGTGQCYVRWFHAGRLGDQLAAGMVLRVHGKVGEHNELAIFTNPKFEILTDEEVDAGGASARLVPVYGATAGLDSGVIARAVQQALPAALEELDEPYDEAYRRERQLPLRRTAIERMHGPTGEPDVEVARRRLAYDELLLMQLALQLRRRAARKVATAPALACTAEIDQRIRARFPFALTAAQNRVVGEIAADLAQRVPMNRLLQGDVGCGKTVVALYAALVAIAHGRQAVILAPTEILAEQHHARIEQYLAGSRVRRALVVGGRGRAARDTERKKIAEGAVDLVVGTHAVFEKGVQFRSLGVVVVDEQHKFGVRQRASIRSKGGRPHYLVMTATPIPRTLSMTAFGDLDVSVIDELPPGRMPVATYAVASGDAADVWQQVRRRLAAGEQAYVVYPLIDESDALPLRAARVEAERLARGELAGFRVGLVHGRMKAEEKRRVMAEFAAGERAVLVATTVIEVGIDVPNATMMVIQHAERMGLSQLHQLRGRVGRGTKGGLCVLLYEKKSETAAARLKIMCDTTDGFRIAEADLQIRGPGELLGTRQHGLPELAVADLVRDYELLVMARQDARQIVAADPTLTAPHHAGVRAALLRRHTETLPLIDVG